MNVSTGKEISVEYTLKSEDQSVLFTNVGSQPLTYVHGSNQIIPALEKALEGLQTGESKQITLKPEEGYGPVDQNAFLQIEKERVPPELMRVGARIQAEDQNGRAFTAKVSEIGADKVVLDFNHPLAGKILHFDVKVLTVREGQPQ
jgi:FKBP-type peptidyl-prolyl cis-trans isomerase 2